MHSSVRYGGQQSSFGYSEVARLDRVIVPGGAVHEDKPDTQVVRVEVDLHDVVGAARFPAIFQVPTIRISFPLANTKAPFSHVNDSGRILLAIANRYRPFHAVTVGLQCNIDVILVE